MSLEEFIITVFCWVEDDFKLVTGGVKLRTGGFAPRLSDSEAITLEIVGEVLGHDGDEAIWRYFKRHGAAWFPGLGDRSTFARQVANLWRVKQLLHDNFPNGLYLSSAPIITANWKAERDKDTWTVPLGGGIGKLQRVGKLPVNTQVQAFYNVKTPEYGPNWTLRFQLQLLFPK